MNQQTEETARACLAGRGLTLIYFEVIGNGLIRRYEALVSTPANNLQIWAWDSSHGSGFWHLTHTDACRR